MSSVTYHPEAELETIAALRWYKTRSVSAAVAVDEALTKAEVATLKHPDRWPAYLHGTRLYLFDGFPYGLVYLPEESGGCGVAVAQLHRRPGYWKTRLADR